MSSPNCTIRRGYTLVEMLLVVSIMALAAAIVVPSMSQPGTLQIQAAARLIMADIIIAQNDAVARQSVRRIVFEPDNNRYRITDGDGQTIGVSWKGGGGDSENYVVDFNSDDRFSSVEIENVDFGAGSKTLEFDDMGSPITGGIVDVAYKATKYRITVVPFTGRVSVDSLEE